MYVADYEASVVLIRMQPLLAVPTAVENILIFDKDDEKKIYDNAIHHLVRKLDRRLLPFIVFLEISSFINRVSIGMCF